MKQTDILVVGSGISGLFFTIKIAQKRPDLSITIMTKEKAYNTNTQLAQGGIATVTDLLNDSYEKHIQDTLESGKGHCDENIVKMVITQAPERLTELMDLGVSFDKNSDGTWNLGLEGGHSERRIIHHKDNTGFEIEQKLLDIIKSLKNVKLLEHHQILDLSSEIINGEELCSGAIYCNKNNKKVNYIQARTIVLSTGGCGQLFENTTNPEIATGDAIAMASRIGVSIADMNYIQFHPTALYVEGKKPYFLISEAVRGFGAYIVNEDQKRFLFKYDTKGELATRDIVSNAIQKEIKTSGKKHVYLDCRHLDYSDFEKHFPGITSHCKGIGLHPLKDLIPIVPAAHYQCGGIKVNENAVTEIKNLYAIGECARTGLHGKNRLASNSLLESLVFAHQALENITLTINEIKYPSKIIVPEFPLVHFREVNNEFFILLKKELQSIMTLFYINEDINVAEIKDAIEILKNKTLSFIMKDDITLELLEFANMLIVSSIVVEHCKKAKKDIPEKA